MITGSLMTVSQLKKENLRLNLLTVEIFQKCKMSKCNVLLTISLKYFTLRLVLLKVLYDIRIIIIPWPTQMERLLTLFKSEEKHSETSLLKTHDTQLN